MFIVFLLALVAITITFFKWRYKFFERISVPSLTPKIPFGDCGDVLTGNKTIAEKFEEFYNIFKSKSVRHGGIFFGTSPQYLPIDPKIVKHILQKDFQYFTNRGVYVNELNDPLSAHLFSLEDSKWKNLRNKITPTFTSGKMKMMFQTITDCSNGLNEIIDENVKFETPCDIKSILARFTTDVIGSVAFGIQCNSLKNQNAEFRKYGRKIFEHDLLTKVKILMTVMLPHPLLRFFKLKITTSDLERFFMKVINDTVEYRENNNVFRKDFMHLLLQLKNRGSITDDEKIVDDCKLASTLTFNELAAQAFVFFGAGFETSSSLMTFALFELSQNEQIQEKLRFEISSVLSRFDGRLTYDAVMEMIYLDKVLCEALRKYPPLPALSRRCDSDYKIPGSSVVIPKGINVIISTLGMHRDPEYYPDPERFDPERFSEENKARRPPFTWIPFGEGPRICIGLRFGMLQSKVGLITLLKDYKFSLNERTKLPIQFDKKMFVLSIDGGVWLNVEKLQ